MLAANVTRRRDRSRLSVCHTAWMPLAVPSPAWRRRSQHPRRNRQPRAWLILPAALALAVTACSSGSVDEQTRTGAPADAAGTTATGDDGSNGAGAEEASGDDGDDDVTGGDGTGAPGADGPHLAASVFEGEIPTVDGATFDLATVANKDLVVWFWAPW